MVVPVFTAIKAISFFKNMNWKKIIIIISIITLICTIFGIIFHIRSLKSTITKQEYTIKIQELQITGLKMENEVLEKNNIKVEKTLSIYNDTVEKMQELEKKYNEKKSDNKIIIKEYIEKKGDCKQTPEQKESTKKLRNFILNKFKEME